MEHLLKDWGMCVCVCERVCVWCVTVGMCMCGDQRTTSGIGHYLPSSLRQAFSCSLMYVTGKLDCGPLQIPAATSLQKYWDFSCALVNLCTWV